MELNYLLFASVKRCFWTEGLVHNGYAKMELPGYVLVTESELRFLTVFGIYVEMLSFSKG